jgi:hypothetical protein
MTAGAGVSVQPFVISSSSLYAKRPLRDGERHFEHALYSMNFIVFVDRSAYIQSVEGKLPLRD